MSQVDLKERIFMALEDPKWDARTAAGIARELKIYEHQVTAVLKSNPESVRLWPFPHTNGDALYIPSSREMSTREILAIFQFNHRYY